MIGLRSLCFNVLYLRQSHRVDDPRIAVDADGPTRRVLHGADLGVVIAVAARQGLRPETRVSRRREHSARAATSSPPNINPCSRRFRWCLKTPDFAIILKKQLLFLPIFGLYLAASGQIAIDRARGRNALAQIIDKAGAVLRSGRQVYIYPEGTRRPPGAEPQYKPGVAFLYAADGFAVPAGRRQHGHVLGPEWLSAPAGNGGDRVPAGYPAGVAARCVFRAAEVGHRDRLGAADGRGESWLSAGGRAARGCDAA